MHLKSLELVGFKSFAERTLMEFGSGMTTVVGPNGCGKSNISDAVRWVLGEQSAKLLRGSKMEDCIFNGTDDRKPLGMAEVSLTLADCEKNLQTEFHEITVTRRVFRSGEGQYFINKTPCRLKDIQRLFMDTGIGTNSYSLMEQGRIDLILSSHPEDRREIFEEASGITKYKTDKREALRKLEQTEANLLRLADIIKEVKRQIISLQRQAGKAARVKKLKQELRSLDIYVSRDRLQTHAGELQQLEGQMASLNKTIEALQKDVTGLEQKGETTRQALADAESDMAKAREAEMEFNRQLQQNQRTLEFNDRRVKELQDMIKQNTGDREAAARDLEKQRHAFNHASELLDKAQAELADREADLRNKAAANAAHEHILDQAKQTIQNLHTESLELADKLSRLQNDHTRMEANDRNLVIKRERCAAEQTEQSRLLEGYDKRLAGLADSLKNLAAAAAAAEAQLAARQKERAESEALVKELSDRRAQIDAQLAAKQAQVQMLSIQLAESGAFPSGARQLLDAANPLGIERQRILGTLAEALDAPPDYRNALEAALRFWASALVVKDLATALELTRQLEAGQAGAAQLLPLAFAAAADRAAPDPGGDAPGVSLLDQVKCQAALRPLAQRLLGNVRVIESLDDLPAVLPPRLVLVTRSGNVVSGTGAVESGYAGAKQAANSPVAHKRILRELQDAGADLERERAALDKRLAEASARVAAGDSALARAQQELETKRHALGIQEGESRLIASQANQCREHLETIRWEFKELEKQGSSLEARSAIVSEMERNRARQVEIKLTVENQNRDLRRLEQELKQLQEAVWQAKVRVETQKQQQQHLQSQHDPLSERIAEQESRLVACAERISAHQAETAALAQAMEDARRFIPDLEAEIKKTGQGLESLRQRREAAAAEWKAAEGKINGLRDTIDQRRNERSEINGKCIELRLKHQNLIDRITAEYRIAPDAIQLEPEPEWPPEGKPDREALENTIAEMRARIEAIGPVYEGAIEEYEQLQERFAFLNQQQDDLVKSKHQLMEMIRKINQTTTDLFAKTFEAINNNFQTTFKQLFGGGSAKLMLADDEDILESGIEIIARPPGKRLQSVSLLSGGERTLTAVALLFAIYMVKPSPFCVLDELDAALDEPNNRRFIKMLEGFLSQSQFIIITHNQQTIAASSVIYGVTMPETGVSKIVSMKFNKNEARPTLEPAGPEPELPPMAAVKPEDQPAEPAAELAAVAESAPAEEPPPAPAGAAPATP